MNYKFFKGHSKRIITHKSTSIELLFICLGNSEALEGMGALERLTSGDHCSLITANIIFDYWSVNCINNKSLTQINVKHIAHITHDTYRAQTFRFFNEWSLFAVTNHTKQNIKSFEINIRFE